MSDAASGLVEGLNDEEDLAQLDLAADLRTLRGPAVDETASSTAS